MQEQNTIHPVQLIYCRTTQLHYTCLDGYAAEWEIQSLILVVREHLAMGLRSYSEMDIICTGLSGWAPGKCVCLFVIHINEEKIVALDAFIEPQS